MNPASPSPWPACVLLTGAGGKVARAVRPYLAARCQTLRLTDIAVNDDDPAADEMHRADLADPARVRELLQGVDAVVHFAGYPREADWPALLHANVQAVACLWEAAVDAGVQRIVYASSNHAVGYYPRSQRIDADAPARPDSRYGVTKVFMEALASLHADKHGLRALGIRIGSCGPRPVDARALAHWVHPEDLAQLIGIGLTAHLHHQVVYGVSANRRSWYDNRAAEQLGYQPVHSADGFEPSLLHAVSPDPVAEHFQGGSFAAAGHRSPVPNRITPGCPQNAARGPAA